MLPVFSFVVEIPEGESRETLILFHSTTIWMVGTTGALL